MNLGKIEFNKIYNINCIDGMEQIPENKIDLIVTDPPFAIDFKASKENYNRTASRVIEGYNEIRPEDYYDFTLSWMNKAFRILKETGSMYVFSGWNNLKDILMALDEAGFITINHIIWKYQFGVVTSKKFVTSHYHCLYVCKNPNKRKFYSYSRFKKMQKQLKEEANTIRIRKTFGTSNENIGQVNRKPQLNFQLNS